MSQRVPIEPEPSRWTMPDPRSPALDEIVGYGADLDAGTLLDAYRSGLFPMRVGPDKVLAWFSPDPRSVIPLGGLHISRTLKRSLRDFEIRIDTDFAGVMRACAENREDGNWIDDDFVSAYEHLFELGWAHSIEVWQGSALVGGLYGVSIGGLFAGESMFHRVTDASKAAMVATEERLRAGGGSLFDVQWSTPHLASMGVVEMDRENYLRILESAIAAPVVYWE